MGLDGRYVFSVSRTGLETACFFLLLEAACLFSSVLFCFVSRTGPETDCFFLFLEAPSLFLPSRNETLATEVRRKTDNPSPRMRNPEICNVVSRASSKVHTEDRCSDPRNL